MENRWFKQDEMDVVYLHILICDSSQVNSRGIRLQNLGLGLSIFSDFCYTKNKLHGEMMKKEGAFCEEI